MPRKHIHQLGTAYRRNYPEQKMEDALRAVVEGGYSFKQAADMFSVPKSTLYDKYRGRHSDRLGRPTVLSVTEERWLVEAMITAGSYGYPFERQTIKEFVQYYLNKKGVNIPFFKHNEPGDDWIQHFMDRNHDLSVRNCENLKRVKADLTIDVINEYFEHLRETIQGVPPENVVNYDETNLTDDPGKKKVFSRRGTKHAHRIMDSSKSSTSVMFAAAGDGMVLAPYVVYKSTNIYPEWMQGGPVNSQYNRTKSGWFDSMCFEDWFVKTAFPFLKRKQGKKILIGDNLASHLSYNVIKTCMENNIHFVFLPKNSTHLCQPLDVAVFGPLKGVWRDVLTEWKKSNREVLPKTVFPSLLRKLLERSQDRISTNVKSGFRAAGIIPCDPEPVLSKIRKKEQNPGNRNDILDSFTEVMSGVVAVPTGATARPKRKAKINVPAGQSVSLNDLKENIASNTSTSRRSSANYDISSDESESDETDEETSKPKKSDAKVPATRDNIEEGCFILVDFIYNRETKKETTKTFVAQVKKLMKKCICVSCLRPHKGKKDAFVFPNVEDENNVDVKQIKFVLSRPVILRGVLIFPELDE